MEASLRASIISYVASQRAGASEPDSVDVAVSVLRELWPEAASAQPSLLLETFAAGKGADAALEADERFQKLLASLDAKGFFAGAEKGTEAYAKRFQKVVAKFRASSAPGAGAPAAAAAPPPPAPAPVPVSADDAERLKNEGNAHLKAGRPDKAIESYSAAIEAAGPGGANLSIYFSNRAAARMQTSPRDVDGAIADAQQSVKADPSFAKGYNRLGSALEAAGRRSEAAAAFERCLDADPDNAVAREELARLRAKDAAKAQQQPARGGGGGGGGGGVGGGGGGLDIASLLKTPGVAEAAKGLMQDPSAMQAAMAAMQGLGGGGGGGGAGGAGLAGLINNPAIAGRKYSIELHPLLAYPRASHPSGSPALPRPFSVMNNPQVQAMMRDPRMMQQAMGMMGGMGGGGGGGLDMASMMRAMGAMGGGGMPQGGGTSGDDYDDDMPPLEQ